MEQMWCVEKWGPASLPLLWRPGLPGFIDPCVPALWEGHLIYGSQIARAIGTFSHRPS